ncbi:DUF4465 domain-containing protein [Rhodopirellula sallentina]|uniref:Secreted protein containing PEP-CTERM bacterial domain protein n=1 Tax=Rhodopirellula sallentina SM41 TaxID=1263870 RepID=M5TYX5_9BACT|nr:DUF4465 domain-containing protein [Rhodopirellula sallentina]EMI54405.1 secreted protein containing PEP-CTERM bacterial domain protein [Rhodopirellula sallentina SM41]
MTQQFRFRCVAALAMFIILSPSLHADVVVDFESFDLFGEADGYLSGPAPNAVTDPNGAYGGPDQVGSYESDGVRFQNVVNAFGSESGFSISNTTDTTSGSYLNESSAIAGGGAEGSSQYAVAFGYHEPGGSFYHPYFAGVPFDATNIDHLMNLPTIFLPEGATAVSALITNTTYAALSMQTGDDFSKQFGGTTGDDPDYLKLSVYGVDAAGQTLDSEVEFYLADYRFDDNSQDYIVDTWEFLDLSPLDEAISLHFNLESSDTNANGMNTPGYFALDNFTYSTTAVPEPGSFAVLTVAAVLSVALRKRGRSQTVVDTEGRSRA